MLDNHQFKSMKLISAKIPEGSMEHIFGPDHPEKVMDFSEMVANKEFWGERIHIVAAIVGSNGSGKSSILNGIRNLAIDLNYERDDNIPRGNNLKIFYSPFIEDSHEFSSGNNSIDVSRYYEMNKDSAEGIQDFGDVYRLHESFKILRNIALLRDDPDGIIISDDLNLPRYSRIKIKLHDSFEFSGPQNTPSTFRAYFRAINDLKQKEKDYRDYLDPIGDYEHKDSDLKIHIISTISNLLLNIFEENGGSYSGRYAEEGLDFEINFSEFDNLEDAFNYFIENASIFYNDRIIVLPTEEIKELTNLLVTNIPPKNQIGNTTEMYVDLNIATTIIVAYRNLQIALLRDFASPSKSHLIFTPGIRLSSGEQSMYNILSTLHNLEYHLKNKTKRYDSFLGYGSDFVANRPKNLLFLFDEADLDFHPLWKKRFISIITKALPRIFPNDTMSIIFTTHDPLTLSDMPSKNVFYLEKRDGVTKFADRKLGTFAANISDLLSDSFFVQDGLIGDFAKKKINEIIDWIRANREPSDREANYAELKVRYKDWISYIDEPITRIKLSEMIGELDDEGKESRNSMIDEEIDRLTKLKDRP